MSEVSGAAASTAANVSDMFEDEVLDLVKFRLNRQSADTSLDDYLRARIAAVEEDLLNTGIILRATPRDEMLVVDMTAWAYGNRDKNEPMPEWLRLARRERWLQQQRATADGGAE